VNKNQSLFQLAKQEIFELQRRRAVARRREKLEAQELKTELELFLDDAHAEGLDPENDPAHFAICLRAWAIKCGEELPVTEDDAMIADHRDMDF
jgi:hypothetical protein